ncbi:MAG: hypothetical protein HZC17_01935 [Candidatus Omnitrophica bacterium]|nr:hypothetical protein [Candidatus Omnitrophota bacterium]
MINKIKSIVVLISFALGTVLPIHISSSQTMVTPQDFQELAPSDKLEEIAVLTIKKLFYYYAQNDLGSFMKLVSENYADTRGMRFEDLPLSFQNDHDILSNIKLELVGVDKVTIHRGVPIKVEVQYRWRSVLTDRDTGVQIKADNNTSVGVVEIGPVEGKIKTASVSNQHFSFFSEAFAGQATKEAEKYLNPKDVKKNADAEKLPKVEPVHGEGRLDFIQRLGLRGHVNSDGTNYYQDDEKQRETGKRG